MTETHPETGLPSNARPEPATYVHPTAAPHMPETVAAEPVVTEAYTPTTATLDARPINAPSAPPADTVAPRGGTPVWLTGLVALVLIGGIYWVWQDRPMPAPAPPSEAPRIAVLEDALKAAQQQIASLQQRPAPDAARVAALEKSVAELAARPVANTGALEARLATLEKRPAPDVASAVAGASAALAAKIETLDTKMQQDLAQATARANQATVMAARLRAAGAALDTGQPVGDVADAPPALARFAKTAPPTEPALRQSFAGFAAAAEVASRPSAEGHDFAERMWMRAQTLVTVRQGAKVLVGAPAAVTLATARGKLEAGDLAGAVAALAPLDGAATTAMAPWKADAQALLDARAALATLAAKS